MKKKVGKGDTTRFWLDTWIGNSPLYLRYSRLYNLENYKTCFIIDRRGQDGWVWDWRRNLRGGREELHFNLLTEELGSVQWSHDLDRWMWDFDGQDDFSVKYVRKSIDRMILPEASNPTRWNKRVPKKVNIMIWRLFLNRLPTRDNLCNKGIDIPYIMCAFCSNEIESVGHIFGGCGIACSAWLSIIAWLDLPAPPDTSPHSFVAWVESLRVDTKKREIIEAIFYTTWWLIWKSRNEAIFQSNDVKKDLIFDDIQHFSFLWITNRYNKLNLNWKEWLRNPLLFM